MRGIPVNLSYTEKCSVHVAENNMLVSQSSRSHLQIINQTSLLLSHLPRYRENHSQRDLLQCLPAQCLVCISSIFEFGIHLYIILDPWS